MKSDCLWSLTVNSCFLSLTTTVYVHVHREHWEYFQRRRFSCSRWRSRVRGFWRGLQRRGRYTFCKTLSGYESPGCPSTTWVSIFTGIWKKGTIRRLFFSLVYQLCGDVWKDLHKCWMSVKRCQTPKIEWSGIFCLNVLESCQFSHLRSIWEGKGHIADRTALFYRLWSRTQKLKLGTNQLQLLLWSWSCGADLWAAVTRKTLFSVFPRVKNHPLSHWPAASRERAPISLCVSLWASELERGGGAPGPVCVLPDLLREIHIVRSENIRPLLIFHDGLIWWYKKINVNVTFTQVHHMKTDSLSSPFKYARNAQNCTGSHCRGAEEPHAARGLRVADPWPKPIRGLYN